MKLLPRKSFSGDRWCLSASVAQLEEAYEKLETENAQLKSNAENEELKSNGYERRQKLWEIREQIRISCMSLDVLPHEKPEYELQGQRLLVLLEVERAILEDKS